MSDDQHAFGAAAGLALPKRRHLLAGLSAGVGAAVLVKTRPARAAQARFRLARLVLGGLPDPRPSALKRWAWELEARTSLEPETEPASVRAADPDLFKYPMLVLSGDQAFTPPADADVIRLRRYLTFGGFLLIDSAEGRAGGAFDDCVRKLLARLLPSDLPKRVSDDHVLWKTFYLLHAPAGRIMAAPYLEAVERDKRIAVLYSQNDLCGALARDGFGRYEHEVIPGGDTQREYAHRLAVNVTMYALCLDYKEEQAHIEFILRSRRSRF
ncbi:MAG: DUF4159 domain-containing protein [Deltaproteobacteria bacterium]|nr:DUF4159 domain-containing protein [Deltaproteobacteria bacterium]